MNNVPIQHWIFLIEQKVNLTRSIEHSTSVNSTNEDLPKFLISNCSINNLFNWCFVQLSFCSNVILFNWCFVLYCIQLVECHPLIRSIEWYWASSIHISHLIKQIGNSLKNQQVYLIIAQAEVVSNCRNKIYQTWGPLLSQAL